MNLQLEELFAVIDHVKASDLALVEYQDQDVRIKIRGRQKTSGEERYGLSYAEGMTEKDSNKMPEKNPVSDRQKSDEKPQSGEAAEACASVYTQESPMVGTFYVAPSENAEPFVKVGDTVREGQTIGIIEAMKLMNEVSADCSGVVEEILTRNEQMVEYGQPLLRIRREE